MPLPTTPQKPASVQPGGGTCMAIELAWARVRKFFLRRLFPGYVQAMQAKRKGECPDCTHDIIDSRDLKYTRNVCGYFFLPEDDSYAYRSYLWFARHGFAEMLLCTLAIAAVSVGLAFLFSAIGMEWTFWIVFVPLLLVELEIIAFFRDPEREIPTDPAAVVSPADGTITHIEEVDEPEFGKALRISIFLSIFNVHVNRCPFTGEVTDVRYFPGEYLDARNPDSAVRNEQLWIDMMVPSPPSPLPEGEGRTGVPSSPSPLPEGEGRTGVPSPPSPLPEGEGRTGVPSPPSPLPEGEGRTGVPSPPSPLPEGEGRTGWPMRVKQISGAIARRIVCWLKKGDQLTKGERIGMIKLGSRTDLLVPAGSAAEVCVKIGDKVKGGATVLLKLSAGEPSPVQ